MAYYQMTYQKTLHLKSKDNYKIKIDVIGNSLKFKETKECFFFVQIEYKDIVS